MITSNLALSAVDESPWTSEEAWVGTRRPILEAHALPAAAYADEHFFDVEREAVFATSWVCVGIHDELSAPGSAIVRQVAAALDDAHANGLVHRDIKPENVLLTADDFAYLVDFGIAHGGGEASVTSTGLVVGSSAYMAPERFGGDRGGPASDVYSLACLLYECLTGRAPFDSADLREVMGAHMFAPPPRPSIMRRGISRAFDDVVARGMAKNPQERHRTAGELARAAAAAVDGETAASVGPAAPVAPVPELSVSPAPRSQKRTSIV